MKFTVVVAMFGKRGSQKLVEWKAPEYCKTTTEACDWAREELWKGKNPKGRVQSVR